MIGAVDLLVLLMAVQLKHLLADYILQSRWMLSNKKHYGHPGGLAHAGLHGILTATVLVWLSLSPALLAAIAVGEAVIHYHIDWVKERILGRAGWTVDNRLYWVASGCDQAAHQATYAGIAAFAAAAA